MKGLFRTINQQPVVVRVIVYWLLVSVGLPFILLPLGLLGNMGTVEPSESESAIATAEESSVPPSELKISVPATAESAPEPTPTPAPTPEPTPDPVEESRAEGLALQQQAGEALEAGDYYGARNLYERSQAVFQSGGLTSEAAIAAGEHESVVAEIERIETPAPTPAPEVQPATVGFVNGTCKDLAAQGLYNFVPGDPNYLTRRDKDGDGIACERQ